MNVGASSSGTGSSPGSPPLSPRQRSPEREVEPEGQKRKVEDDENSSKRTRGVDSVSMGDNMIMSEELIRSQLLEILEKEVDIQQRLIAAKDELINLLQKVLQNFEDANRQLTFEIQAEKKYEAFKRFFENDAGKLGKDLKNAMVLFWSEDNTAMSVEGVVSQFDRSVFNKAEKGMDFIPGSEVSPDNQFCVSVTFASSPELLALGTVGTPNVDGERSSGDSVDEEEDKDDKKEEGKKIEVITLDD